MITGYKTETRTLLPEHIAAYYNPVSTHHLEAEECVDYVRSACKRLGVEVTKHTTEFDQKDMDESLEQSANESSCVIIASGDGGASSVLEASLKHPDKPTVQIVPCGNANDIANMLYGARVNDDPLTILQNGRTARLHPIIVEATQPSGEKDQIYAFGYWGAGVTGHMAGHYTSYKVRTELDEIEETRGPEQRFLRELSIAIEELRKAEVLTIVDSKGEHTAVEVNIINGKRQSKTAIYPADLLTAGAILVEVKRPSVTSALATVARAMLDRVVRIGCTNAYEFRIDNDVVTQNDGQVHKFIAGTDFSTGISDKYANVIALEQNGTVTSERGQRYITHAKLLGNIARGVVLNNIRKQAN